MKVQQGAYPAFHKHVLRPLPTWGAPSLGEVLKENGLLHLLAACGYTWRRDYSYEFPLIRIQTVPELYRLEQVCRISRLFEKVDFFTYTDGEQIQQLHCGPIRPEAEAALLSVWQEEPAFKLCRIFFQPDPVPAEETFTDQMVCTLSDPEKGITLEEIIGEPFLLYVVQCLILWRCERLVLPYYGRSKEDAKRDAALLLLQKVVGNLRVYGVETSNGFQSRELAIWGIRQEVLTAMNKYLYGFHGG